MSSCVLNLLREKNLANCSFSKIPITQVVALKRDHTWYLSAPPGEFITLTCGTEVNMRKLPPSGIIAFSDDCSLKAENFRIDGIHQILIHEEIQPIKLYKNTTLNENRTLGAVKKLLEDDTDPWLEPSSVPTRDKHYVMTIISMIIGVLVIGFLIWKPFQKCFQPVPISSMIRRVTTTTTTTTSKEEPEVGSSDDRSGEQPPIELTPKEEKQSVESRNNEIKLKLFCR